MRTTLLMGHGFSGMERFASIVWLWIRGMAAIERLLCTKGTMRT